MNEDMYRNQESSEGSQENAPDTPRQEEIKEEQTQTAEQQAYAPRMEQQPRVEQVPPQAPPQYNYQAQQTPPNQGYVPPPGQYPYGVPRQQRDNNKYWWLLGGLGAGCLLWAIFGFVLLAGIGMIFGGGTGDIRREHVALIHVNGVITAGRSSSGVFGGNVSGSEDLVAQLEEVRKNSNAKAVVIRVNSPGLPFLYFIETGWASTLDAPLSLFTTPGLRFQSHFHNCCV